MTGAARLAALKPCRSVREGAMPERSWNEVGAGRWSARPLVVPSAGEVVPPVVGVDFPGGRPCLLLLVAVSGEIARPTPLVFGEQCEPEASERKNKRGRA